MVQKVLHYTLRPESTSQIMWYYTKFKLVQELYSEQVEILVVI